MFDTGRRADHARAAAADAVDRRQRNLRVLLVRNIYATDAGHILLPRYAKKLKNRTTTCQFVSVKRGLTRQPCRCLWRGSLQITRTTRLRRTILQLRQTFFTDASTFMLLLSCASVQSLSAKN